MSTVNVDVQGHIAVMSIDHPPANVGSAAQRAALADALARAADEPEIEGVVITGAARHFYAGSDLREFDGEIASPQLPDVIGQIESLPVPVVAAIRGLALGGGLELALACDGRIADSSARLGFPEVTLGMLPGAGGTVRAARLLGVPAAVDMVTSARQVEAAEALSMGLLDALVPAEELVAQAQSRARGHDKRRLRDVPVPPAEAGDVETTLTAVSRRARPNVRQAAELIVQSAESEFDAALAAERALFNELRQGEEAQNLRHLFFARRSAAKALRGAGKPREVRSVGIAGAGTMGAALASTFAAKGYPVLVADTDAAALERLYSGVATTRSLADLHDRDFVVDAVFEDMAVKKALLTEVEPVLHEDAVIVSNTSYLDLDAMSGVLARPERFAGLHFFNPPDRNPLVEVISARATSAETAATLAAVVSGLGKTGIPAGVGEGFVANHVFAAYRTQVEFLVEEGASPGQVDAALVDRGLAIGPFAVADMSGLDIAWARRKSLEATRDPRCRYVRVADALCEEGRFGRKTGAGWYRYPDGARRGESDPHVAELIERCRAEKGIAARVVPDDEIWERTLGAMVAAAAEVVASGVARCAGDVDLALTEGFAFPKERGGPLRAFSRFSVDQRVAALAAVYRSCPKTFAVLEPAARGGLPSAVTAVLDQVTPLQHAGTKGRP